MKYLAEVSDGRLFRMTLFRRSFVVFLALAGVQPVLVIAHRMGLISGRVEPPGWFFLPLLCTLLAVHCLRISRVIARSLDERKSWTSRSVIRPPGMNLRDILSILYGQKTMTNIFDPLIGDIREEWLAHMIAGREGAARATRLRGYVQILMTVVANGGASLVVLVVRLYKLKSP